MRWAAVVRWVRTAPGTYLYLAILLVTASVLDSASAKAAHELVLERSTNLHQLAIDPIRVIFESAFWVAAPWEALVWGVLFTLVLAPAEHWLGTLRWAAVLAAGHVGATLVTAAGLWAAVETDLVERSVRHSVDVGASYGFLAVAGVLVYRLPRHRRVWAAGAVAAGLLALLAIDHSYVDVGHLIAFAIGLACYPVTPGLRQRPGGRRVPTLSRRRAQPPVPRA
jgi:hypothetical protein